MNKILVIDGIINSSSLVSIDHNNIIFNESGNYIIEYVNTRNVCISFYVENGANVNLQEISFDNDIVVNNNYIISSGTLTVNKFYSNKLVNENIIASLNSEGAIFNYNFSSVCLLQEKYNITINHNAKKSVSNINNRSVTLRNGKLDFIINSNVLKNMNDSVLNQTTRVVTFDDSEASISPNMFIDCNQVMAKHGSVIGTIDENIIFYLMSRGIDYNTSLKLYIKGFLFADSSVDFDIKNRIFKVIDMYWR